MKTSYFARAGKWPYQTGVSIALRAPRGFTGRVYPALAPTQEMLDDYRRDHDELKYTDRYYAEILSKLDAKSVFTDLGEDAVLLCWEGPGKFCHRRLIASWFEHELGISVEEA